MVVGLLLGVALGRDSRRVVVDLAFQGGIVPVEHLLHQLRHMGRGLGAPIEGFDGDSGSTCEDVIEVQRSLVRGGVQGLYREIVGRALERLDQLRSTVG